MARQFRMVLGCTTVAIAVLATACTVSGPAGGELDEVGSGKEDSVGGDDDDDDDEPGGA